MQALTRAPARPGASLNQLSDTPLRTRAGLASPASRGANDRIHTAAGDASADQTSVKSTQHRVHDTHWHAMAEVRAVGEPERSVRRIAEHAGIDGVAVFNTVGPDDWAAVLPPEVGRVGVERRADEQSDGGLRLRACGRVVNEVLGTRANHVRRPGVVAAAREYVWTQPAARDSLHQCAAAPPAPAVLRN